MKVGKNKLEELIDFKVQAAVTGNKILYLATVTDTSPLTIQPLVLTADGKKMTAVTGVRQLDFNYLDGTGKDTGGPRKLKVGDDVLVGILADSVENYTRGKAYKADLNRFNSVDSSIVIGVVR